MDAEIVDFQHFGAKTGYPKARWPESFGPVSHEFSAEFDPLGAVFRRCSAESDPRGPLRSPGPAPHINVYEKSAPQANLEAKR